MRGDYAVRNAFRKAMPGARIERGIGQARAGREVPDVDAPGLWIESKCGKLPNPRGALRQAQGDSEGSGRLPLAVIRDDRKAPFVVMALDDFLQLVEAWHREREGMKPAFQEMVEAHIDQHLRQARQAGLLFQKEAP